MIFFYEREKGARVREIGDIDYNLHIKTKEDRRGEEKSIVPYAAAFILRRNNTSGGLNEQ
jgi:hypothetical protein